MTEASAVKREELIHPENDEDSAKIPELLVMLCECYFSVFDEYLLRASHQKDNCINLAIAFLLSFL